MKKIIITESQLNKLNYLILSEQQNIDLPRKFEEIPEGNNNWRSSQPTLSQLEYILKTYNIENVIRMNKKEGTEVTTTEEKDLVEDMGINYYWINAHLGYKKGEGYLISIDEALPILEEGNTLIHCTGGRDRTGYIVAEYLQQNFGWDKDELWEYTVKFNNWKSHICNNTGNKGYIKYMEGFYPLDEWCKKYDINNNCPNCEEIIYTPEDEEIESPSKELSDDSGKINDFDMDIDGKLIRRWIINDTDNVKRIQTMLSILGYDLGFHGIDGKFGPDTESAVKEFQKDVFTDKEEWDGIIGPNTYEELIVEIDEISKEEGVDREELIDSFDSGEDKEQDEIYKDEEELNVYDIPDIPTGEISRSQYIDLWKNIAIAQMSIYNIPASITLAQGIVESGNGNSRLARKGNNHFGIKCHRDWVGETITASDDRPNECFRKYPNDMGSFEDHSQFLRKHGRYDFLFNLEITDYVGWANGLQKAGYATNPKYADTLINVIERNNLSQYDREVDDTTFDDPTMGFPTGEADSNKAMVGGVNGDWDGSMPRALAIARIAQDSFGGDDRFSQKREQEKTAAGNISQHWVGSTASYAIDLIVPDVSKGSPKELKGDKLWDAIVNYLGEPGLSSGKWENVFFDGYRYNLGWRVKGHYDHIHVGVKRDSTALAESNVFL